jgi:putative ABC transport system permease protein
MTVICVLVSSLLASLIQSTINSKGDWHFFSWGISNDLVYQIQKDYELEKIATITDLGYSNIQDNTNVDKPYVNCNAVSYSFFSMIPIQVINGRFPENEYEIVVPTHFINDYPNVEIGNYYELNLGRRISTNDGSELTQNSSHLGANENLDNFYLTRKYLIVGITETIVVVENSYSPGYTFLTVDEYTTFEDKIIYFKLLNPKKSFSRIIEIIPETNIAFNNDLLTLLGLGRDETLKDSILILAIVLLSIIIIAALSLVTNSFNITINERQKEHAIIRSIGATNKQLISIVIYESLILSVLIIPISILSGIGVVWLSINSIGQMISASLYSDMSFTLNVNFFTLFIVFIMSFFLVLFSALFSGLKIRKTNVIELVRQNDVVYTKKNKRKYKIFKNHKTPIEVDLVNKNFSRSLRKHKYVIASLVLSMVIYVAAGSFSAYATVWLNSSKELIDYDIVINSYSMPINETIDKIFIPISTMTEIDESGWSSYTDGGFVQLNSNMISDFAIPEFSDDNNLIQHFYYIFIDDSRFNKLAEISGKVNSSFFNKETLSVLILDKIDIYHVENNNYIVQSGSIFKNKITPLTLDYMNDDAFSGYYANPNSNVSSYSKKIEVVGHVINSEDLIIELSNFKDSNGIYVILPISMIDSYYDDNIENVQMFFTAQNHKAVFEKITNYITNNKFDAYATDMIADFEMQENRIVALKIFSNIFAIVISIVLILNIFNTTLANLLIRKRDFMILRSIGISKKDVIKMLLYEHGVYSIISIFIGLCISFVLSWAFRYSVIPPENLILPFKNIIISIIGTLVVQLISMLYAIRKILSNKIIESIKTELT